jgi:hypothetical protein
VSSRRTAGTKLSWSRQPHLIRPRPRRKICPSSATLQRKASKGSNGQVSDPVLLEGRPKCCKRNTLAQRWTSKWEASLRETLLLPRIGPNPPRPSKLFREHVVSRGRKFPDSQERGIYAPPSSDAFKFEDGGFLTTPPTSPCARTATLLL